MFATYWSSRILKIGPYWTLLLVVPFLFLVGYLLQSALLNRLLRRDPDAIEPVSALLLTLGIALVLDNGALLLFGSDYRTLATKSHTITIAGYGLDPRRIAIVIVAVGLTACLHLGIKHSRLGLALRVVAQDREAASLQGVDVFRMYAVAFGAGAAIVAVCAGLLAPLYYIHPSVGLVFLITGFLVVVLGGLGSIKGTAAAAWVVGFMEAAIARVFSASAAQAAVFLLFIGFLLLRPEGLSRRGSRIA